MLLKMKANEEHSQKIKHGEFSSVVLEMLKWSSAWREILPDGRRFTRDKRQIKDIAIT